MNSAKLAAVPPLPVRVEDGFSQIFGAIDKLENLESIAAELAPDATDKQLIDGRVYATQLGKTAWKIVVIFDAEIWKRTKRLVGGRGNKDEDEKGILKAVDKQAHELGCGASTIHANARIFNTFESILTTQNTLEDKGFYQAALASKDPHRALEHFAKKRSESPFFKPADAWRYVNAQKKPPKRPGVALQSVARRALAEHIKLKAMPAILDLQTNCPNPKFASANYSQWYQDLKEALEELEREDFSESLVNHWRNGKHKTKELAGVTGQSTDFVYSVLRDLEESGILERVEQGGETDEARGKNEMIWHLVGEPVGSNAQIPRAQSKYQS